MGGHTLAEASAALESLDAEVLVSHYAGSFRFQDAAAAKTITTRDDLLAYFRSLFALPDVGFTITAIFEDAEFGAIEWTWSGTSRAYNRPYSIMGASIFQLGEQGIERETIYYDPRPALS